MILVAIAIKAVGAEPTQSSFQCPGANRALVISGGGVRGAYQIGALWYLVNVLHCDFKHYFGTSTGAVAAAVLAQATNHAQLAEQVDLLKTEYEQLRAPSQIASERFLGLYRFFLPTWLGGVDGAATLAPLEKRLRTYIRDSRVPYERLSILVTSLQAGSLDPRMYRADNLFDLVLGSASIPLAVQPRLVRFRIPARATVFSGDLLTVRVDVLPGLPDSHCELQLSASRSLRCAVLESNVTTKVEPLSTNVLGFPPQPVEHVDVDARLRLKLFDLSPVDRELLINAVALEANSGTRGETALTISTLHQIVDGGVVANIPLQQAVRVGEFDTIFTLLAGHSSALGLHSTEVHGGKNILGSAFDILWEQYQYSALRSAERFLSINDFTCGYYSQQRDLAKWLGALERKIGEKTVESAGKPPEFVFTDDTIFYGLISGLVDDCEKQNWKRWQIITFDPGQSDMSGPLTPEHTKIVAALGQGCRIMAARTYLDSKGGSSTDADVYANEACQGFTESLK